MPVARAFWASRTIGILDVLALAHHQVGQLVDDDDDVRHPVFRIHPGLVERPDVAGRGAGEPPVARLHLVDRPLERGLGPLGLGDDRHEQVRQAVVGRELDPLEVHEDHPDVVRGRLAQQARDQRVDHDALARAGRAGDEQVRHLGEVDRLGLAGHVPPERERQRGARRLEVDVLEDPAQGDDVEVRVRDLDADRALARDRRLDPQRAGGEGHRQVVGEAFDPADLDVRRRLDLVLGHDRAGVPADDLGRDLEARELADDDLLVTRAWAAASPPAWIGIAMSSSRLSSGRMYSIRSRVGGESPASVTSSGSRSRAQRIGDRDGRGRRSGSRPRVPARTWPRSGLRSGRRRDRVAGGFLVLAPDPRLAGRAGTGRRGCPWRPAAALAATVRGRCRGRRRGVAA